MGGDDWECRVCCTTLHHRGLERAATKVAVPQGRPEREREDEVILTLACDSAGEPVDKEFGYRYRPPFARLWRPPHQLPSNIHDGLVDDDPVALKIDRPRA